MQVRYKPEGGRFGYGFDYFCAECDEYVGNSVSDKQLKHRAIVTKGFFNRTTVPVKCSNAGKVCEIPRHIIEAREVA